MSTLRVVQITDCHLGGEPGEKLLGLDTDESLADVLSLVRQRETNIDHLVVSGDVASYGQVGAYQRFPALIRHYLQAPIAWLAGNHDLDSRMRANAADVVMDKIVLGAWQIILLDSSVPGSEHGDLDSSELQRLEQCLQDSDKHTLIFVHHQPKLVGSVWIDQYVIRNGDRLLRMAESFPQVKGIVFGHVHQEFEEQLSSCSLLATPSTCIQFKPGSADFALDNQMPGYRWFDLHDDGSFDSEVVRVEQKNYNIDFSSDGY